MIKLQSGAIFKFAVKVLRKGEAVVPKIMGFVQIAGNRSVYPAALLGALVSKFVNIQ